MMASLAASSAMHMDTLLVTVIRHNNQHTGKLLAVVGDQAGRPTVRLSIHGFNVTALVDTLTFNSVPFAPRR